MEIPLNTDCPCACLLVGHPTGNQFFRHLLRACAEAGILGAAATSIEGGAVLARWGRLLPGGVRRELSRRDFTTAWSGNWITRPGRELGRFLAPRIGLGRLIEGEVAPLSVDAIYRDFDAALARKLDGFNGVYLYEDGAATTFEAAKSRGIGCYYDLPIAYWETVKRLLAEEAERLPSWAPTLKGGVTDSDAKRDRKTHELELADQVIVPSAFVAASLPAWAQSKAVVAPFGSPPPPAPEVLEAALEIRRSRASRGEPLRVLFAGSMSQRKGLADLFEAVRFLGGRGLELVVMGSPQAPMEFYGSLGVPFRHEGGRPHAEVLELMRSCDVFCLPSIVEGRALVIQEAMSQGLPVILTPNTGASDVVTGVGPGLPKGDTGFVVPIRSAPALAEALEWCLGHRQETSQMGVAAAKRAQDLTWNAYGQRIVDGIRSTTAGARPFP